MPIQRYGGKIERGGGGGGGRGGSLIYKELNTLVSELLKAFMSDN